MQVSADPLSDLSHIDASGAARMVDVSGKNVTERRAVARARVQMSPSTALRVERADGPKGDVIGPARLAGIMAAKRTGELIPLCHPLGLDFIDVRATIERLVSLNNLETTSVIPGQKLIVPAAG